MKYNSILVAFLVSVCIHKTIALSISDAYANSGRNINVDQEHFLPEKDESELEPELDPELDPEFDHDAEYGDEEGDASSIISTPSPTTSTTISTTSTTTVRPGPVNKSKWNNKRISKPHKKPLTMTSTGVKHLEKQVMSKTKEHEKQIISSGLAPPSPVYEPGNVPTSSEEKSTGGDEKNKDSDRKLTEFNDDASEKDNSPTGWPQDGKLTKEEALSVNRIGQAAASGPFGNNRPSFNPSGLSNQLPWGIANFKLAGANDNNNYDGFPSLAAKMAAYPHLVEHSETSPTPEHQESDTKSGFDGSSPFGENNNQSPYGYPPYGYNPSANPASSYPPYNRMTSYPPPPFPTTSSSGPSTWGGPPASSLEMVESLLKKLGNTNSPWSGGASAGGGYGSYPPYNNYPPSSPPPDYNAAYPSQNSYSNNMYGATINFPWGGENSQAWGQEDPQSAYKSWGGYNPQRTGPFGNGGSLSSYNNALAIQQLLGGGGGMTGGNVDGNNASNNPGATGSAPTGEAFGTKSESPSTASSPTFGPGYKNMYNNKQSHGGNSGYYLPSFGSGFNSRQGIYSGQDPSAYDGGFPSYGGDSGLGGWGGGKGYNPYLEYIKQAVAYAAQNRRKSNPYAQTMGMWGGDNSRGYSGYPSLGYPPSSSYQQPQMPWWASQTNYGNYR